MVLAPLTTVPFGRESVITSVEKPPPIPPKLLAGSGILTVPLLRGIQALVLTWTLASFAYRTPCTWSQRDRTDLASPDCSATVLLTVVPSALNTSIGNNTRSVAVSANPMGLAMTARNRDAKRFDHTEEPATSFAHIGLAELSETHVRVDPHYACGHGRPSFVKFQHGPS